MRPKRSASGPQMQLGRAEAEEVSDHDQLAAVFLGDVERAADVGQRRDHRVDGERVERHQQREQRGHLARSGPARRARQMAVLEWHEAALLAQPRRDMQEGSPMVESGGQDAGAADRAADRQPFVVPARGGRGARRRSAPRLYSDHANMAAESGEDVTARGRRRPSARRERGRRRAHPRRRRAARSATASCPLFLGGDHMVTYPIVAGLAAERGPVAILHFDAHPDLYDDFDGDPLSHASPFARIMERKLASRLVQVGIRTANAPLPGAGEEVRRRDGRDARLRAGPGADPGGAAVHQHRHGRARPGLRAGRLAPRARRAVGARHPVGARTAMPGADRRRRHCRI